MGSAENQSDAGQSDAGQSDADLSGERTDSAWLSQFGFRRIDQASEDWLAICRCGATADLVDSLRRNLQRHFAELDDFDATLSNLSRFVLASRSPTALLALFERDESALVSLLYVFSTGQTLATYLIDDPEGFDLMRASDGLPAQRRYLVDELVSEIKSVDDDVRASHVIGNFVKREIVRIAYGEFVRSLSPDQAGRQLTWVADAALESALEYSLRACAAEQEQPQRIDGAVPRLTVIGLGNFGGQELSYASPLEVVFLYDAIDEKNPSHKEFYREVAGRTINLVGVPDVDSLGLGFHCELSRGPYREVSLICGVDEAIDVLETKNRTWQRMSFAKARVAAGDNEVGEAFLRRTQPWIYHRFMSQSDFDDVRTLRRKLVRRAAKPMGSSATELRQSADVLLSAGGRRDIELTVQFLQLFHGGESPTVRVGNTMDAIVALEKDGCLLHAEAELLAANYARLCRLHHQLSVMFGRDTSHLPVDEALFGRVAWRLGVRDDEGDSGDGDRFAQQLSEALAMNCTVINHLMIDAPDDGGDDQLAGDANEQVETELVLDPDVSQSLVLSALSRHGLADPIAAMEKLSALSMESVPFLSPRRCRHFLAAIAPKLLQEISKTPFPDQTLRSLVEVTDSLGAKATLWELLGANPPTMDLMVRLGASAAYLRNILIQNPGMIDELVDSLLMNRLPSGDRLDAQSIELCRGAADVGLILQGFKNSAHLTIGVRDILNKESVEKTHRALSDTAEACLRRVIENEQATLAAQFGDPVGEDGEPAELIAVALGKFGGREPNYHSDLDVIFLYSQKGETQRRVGGPRTTVSNHRFFNQLAQRVVERITRAGPQGQLYELDGRLRPTGDEGTLAVSVSDFLKRFQHDVAPLWQRLALCKARCVSGSRRLKQSIDRDIKELLVQTRWHDSMANEIREMRMRMQDTAAQENLKRAEGGTADVEVIAQMLTLRHAGQDASLIRQGTIESLDAIAKAGFLSDQHALTLANCYRTLRRIESRLRLLNTDRRHELPRDEQTSRNLAFLMNESDPTMIIAQAEQSRHTIRKLFNQIFDETHS